MHAFCLPAELELKDAFRTYDKVQICLSCFASHWLRLKATYGSAFVRPPDGLTS